MNCKTVSIFWEFFCIKFAHGYSKFHRKKTADINELFKPDHMSEVKLIYEIQKAEIYINENSII